MEDLDSFPLTLTVPTGFISSEPSLFSNTAFEYVLLLGRCGRLLLLCSAVCLGGNGKL